MLLVFTFYPLYKYYVVGVVPFLALMARRRRDAVGFIAFSLALMLVPRYFASWALLITLVWLLRRDAKLQPVWFLRSLLRRSDRSGTGVPDAA